MKLNFWPFNRKKFPVEGKNNFGFIPIVNDRKGHLLCPNCGGSEWVEGPEGGGSQNIQCGKCYKYYNYMGPFGLQDIGDRSSVWGLKKPEV